MKIMNRVILLGLLVSLSACAGAMASGMLIPKDESLPPLAIKHQRVDIRIKDGVATAKIEQVFKNNVDRDLEAVYVFPLPQDASIGDFAMYINGKRMSGELVEKDKARKIYEDIVRRMKDPGLLEYLGGNLFKISVYPVPRNGEQRIELEYSQALAFDGGLYQYVFPLKTGEQSSRTLEDFTVSAKLNSRTPIKNIYSPSHEVGITRKGEHEATIGFEMEQALLDKDFVLYYGVSKKDFGLNLLTHATEGQDGFFMMMLAPTVEPPGGKALAKDVVFVFDTSGSMAGKKIEQARDALAYGINRLNEGDRFNVIRFSTEVEMLADKLLPVNAESRERAMAFVEKIVARGGTAIDEALRTALEMNYDKDRPGMIMFLTDGKPTIGESDTDSIVKNSQGSNKAKVRLFVFGVGDRVNAHLLDKLSGGSGGRSRYVKPEEDIEVNVSSLVDRMSNPVLARPRIEVDKIDVLQMHPRELPDLFSSDQLTVFGRYKGAEHVAIRLVGEVNGKEQTTVYEGDFLKLNVDNDFIPRLWATRRVGYLLEEIRLHGEEGELKDEVIRLSKEYGIMTPYTSYLVLEDDKAYEQHDVPRVSSGPAPGEVFAMKEAGRRTRDSGRGGAAAGAPVADRIEADASAMVPVFEAQSADALQHRASVAKPESKFTVVKAGKADVNGYMNRESGGKAIELSEAIESYKKRETVGDGPASVRHVGKKIFYLIDGQWVDGDYRKDMKTRTVPFASEEYFRLIEEQPELKAFLALGERVIVVLGDGTALAVE